MVIEGGWLRVDYKIRKIELHWKMAYNGYLERVEKGDEEREVWSYSMELHEDSKLSMTMLPPLFYNSR